jgi:aryl-alcohol dehydrogenase-like predicted oxidoreductase
MIVARPGNQKVNDGVSSCLVQKMVLGTAQFGMNYGIANLVGKPGKNEIFKILSIAWEAGVRRFDTAPGYGSEKVLGEFILTHGLQKTAKVSTKISSLQETADYKERLMSSIDESIRLLGCPIEELFMHDAADSALLLNDPTTFQRILDDSLISSLGVSVYEPNEVEKFSECQFELAIQFPYNVLDRRFKSCKMSVGRRFARSIFLQGLLAKRGSLKSGSPEYIHDLHEKYHTKIAENSLHPVQYALSFIAQSTTLDFFLFGVDTVGQLEEIVSMPLYKGAPLAIMDTFSDDLDSSILDPRKWN